MRTSSLLLLGLASIIVATPHANKFQSTGFVTTKDNTQIFYKDWGNPNGKPIVFSHGWPLNGDSWNNQMLFLGQQGYRVIAHDRRGHGSSSQPWTGNDMNTYADDLSALFEHLNLKDATVIGHSTGGGEITRFLGRHGTSRVSKAVLVGAITPFLLKTPSNPGGMPITNYDRLRASYIANRAQDFLSFAEGPFFGYNGTVESEGTVQEFMQQALRSGFVNAYDCIKAIFETDFRNDMKGLNIPVLIIHGSADQVAPIAITALLGIKLLKKGTLKIYPGGAHALPQTATQQLNQDLLEFIRK